MNSVRFNFFLASLCLMACSTFAQSITADCSTTFAAAVLKAHNAYRTLHHVPNLVVDAKLTDIAMNYARNLSATNSFQHSGNGYGENLAYFGTTGTLPSCASIADMFVKMWYDEIKDYNFAAPGFSAATGHFTQVVWKSSTNVGCGLAIKNGVVHGVCNYYPPGNYLGQFPTNVLKI